MRRGLGEEIRSFFRDFLFRWLNKEFLIFAFFLLVSSFFWLMLTLNETSKKEVDIPVVLTGVPKNVVLTTPIADTVRVTVSGKGFLLLFGLQQPQQKAIKVDFNKYANLSTGYGQVPANDVKKLVRDNIIKEISITSIKPEKLEFYFNFGLSKQVPVKLRGRIKPGGSYYLAGVSSQPEKVTVYSDKKRLDSIKYIYTEMLNISNFEDTITRTVKLQTMRGVKVVPNQVVISLYSDILTEESIEVPITAQNMPAGKVLRTFPAKVRVRFSVGASQFRSIKASQFLVVADYKELMAHPSEKCTLHLRTSPSTARKARLETTQVDYLIEQQ